MCDLRADRLVGEIVVYVDSQDRIPIGVSVGGGRIFAPENPLQSAFCAARNILFLGNEFAIPDYHGTCQVGRQSHAGLRRSLNT